MSKEVILAGNGALAHPSGALPGLIVRAGASAEKRFIEYFAAQIRNRNTREAYLRAVADFAWCEDL